MNYDIENYIRSYLQLGDFKICVSISFTSKSILTAKLDSRIISRAGMTLVFMAQIKYQHLILMRWPTVELSSTTIMLIRYVHLVEVP